MNKIYLDKLCEFTHTTWKNYGQFNLKDKDFNVEQQINIIKQNMSLNEKGVSNKYNYIELSSIIPEIESDQLILLLPIVWNINKNHEWYYLLNSVLILLNDEYMFQSSLLKKKTIETLDKTFSKKIVIDDKITEDIIEKVAKLTNITLIILTSKSKHIYNNKTSNDKVIVLYKTDNPVYEYYPVMNWTDKFFKKTDLFVKYLTDFEFKNSKHDNSVDNTEDSDDLEKETREIDEKIKKNKSTKKKTTITIDEDKNTINKIKNNLGSTDKSDGSDKSNKLNNNDFYEEVFTEANNAIFISEAVDNKESIVSSTSKKNDEIKKTKSKKNTKDIFVPNVEKKSPKEDDKNKDNKNKVVEEDSVFKKTEVISKKELNILKETVKPNMGLDDLQKIALKLSIVIIQGSTKSGKPKRKTKQELYDEIQEYIKNFDN